MNATNQVFQTLLDRICPPTERECIEIDAAMHADKLADGFAKRNEAAAMALQIKFQDKGVEA